jgi:hypothetical protein
MVALLLLMEPAVGKDTFEASLKSLDYLGWLVCFGNASGKPDPLDVLR